WVGGGPRRRAAAWHAPRGSSSLVADRVPKRSESERARSSSMADGQEVERRVEVAVGAQLEVGRRDRGHEAIVEGLREAKGAVHAVPPQPQGQLVDAQLSRVVDAEHIDVGEVGLEQG